MGNNFMINIGLNKNEIKKLIYVLSLILLISSNPIFSQTLNKIDSVNVQKKNSTLQRKSISIFGGVSATYTDWQIGPLNSLNSVMDKLTIYNLLGDFQRAAGTTTKIFTGVENRITNMELIGFNGIIKSGENWSISYLGTVGNSGFNTYGYQGGTISGRFDSYPQQYTNTQNYLAYLPFNTKIRRNDHSLVFNKNIYRINCNHIIFGFLSYKYQDYTYDSKPGVTPGFEENRISETGEYVNNNRLTTGQFLLNTKLNGPGLGFGYTYIINTINSINLSIGLINMQGTINQSIDLLGYNNAKFSSFRPESIFLTSFKLQEFVNASGYTLDGNYNFIFNNILLRIHLIHQVTVYSTSNTNHSVSTIGYNSIPNSVSTYGVPISFIENLAGLSNTGFNQSKDTFNGISFSIMKNLY